MLEILPHAPQTPVSSSSAPRPEAQSPQSADASTRTKRPDFRAFTYSAARRQISRPNIRNIFSLDSLSPGTTSPGAGAMGSGSRGNARRYQQQQRHTRGNQHQHFRERSRLFELREVIKKHLQERGVLEGEDM